MTHLDCSCGRRCSKVLSILTNTVITFWSHDQGGQLESEMRLPDLALHSKMSRWLIKLSNNNSIRRGLRSRHRWSIRREWTHLVLVPLLFLVPFGRRDLWIYLFLLITEMIAGTVSCEFDNIPRKHAHQSSQPCLSGRGTHKAPTWQSPTHNSSS